MNMWRREGDNVASPQPAVRQEGAQPTRSAAEGGSRSLVGPGLEIKGELKGSEDVTIDGRLDGEIALPDHTLSVGPKGRLQAQVTARVVVVEGEAEGRLEATEALHLKKTARVRGELVAPRIVLEDGCRFQGSIDMESKRTAGATRERAATPPAPPTPLAST